MQQAKVKCRLLLIFIPSSQQWLQGSFVNGKCLACTGGDDCCNGECGVGEGDCDHNDDCAGNLLCGSNNCIGLTFEGSDDCCYVSIETNTFLYFFVMNTRKDPSAMAQMIAVTDSVEKVKETVTGTVTVLASWSVARQTVWGKDLMIMMIAVRNLRTYSFDEQHDSIYEIYKLLGILSNIYIIQYE